MEENIKSKCCNASVKTVCADKFPDEGSTWHYECEKCKKPCDVLMEDIKEIIKKAKQEERERIYKDIKNFQEGWLVDIREDNYIKSLFCKKVGKRCLTNLINFLEFELSCDEYDRKKA